MRHLIVFVMLLVLLFAGCSFVDTEEPAGMSHMRLLVGSTSKTLSDPAHDDWSPSIVEWQGIKYLYFLSTRPFTNIGMYMDGNWNTNGTKTSDKTVGIFRARQEYPGVFSNLQLFYEFTNPSVKIQNILAISNSGGSLPEILCVKIDGDTNIVRVFNDINVAAETSEGKPGGGNPVTIGGTLDTASGPYVFFVENNIETRVFLITNGIPFNVTSIRHASLDFGETPGFRSRISVKRTDKVFDGLILLWVQNNLPRLGEMSYNENMIIDGASPAFFPNPIKPGQKQFGFYTSINGILSAIVHTDSTNFDQYQNNSPELIDTFVDDPTLLRNKLYIPLLTITHYPGTVDKNPSYHPATTGNPEGKGLYFASDREGKGVFNLYYVPDEYLRIPPELLADLPPLP